MTVSPVSSEVNEATSRVSGTSVTAASLTSVPLATASVTAGGTRKRRSVDVVSPDRVVRQYFFNNSAGNEMFSTILHVVYCTQWKQYRVQKLTPLFFFFALFPPSSPLSLNTTFEWFL